MSITVVGASNWDMFTYVENMPRVGETIKGIDFKVSFGGKAANQAVQAALLGSKCSIITKLSDDVSGVNTLKNFKDKNVNCDHVSIVKDVPSGCATIIVDSKGDNNIIIVGGANDKLSVQDIENAKTLIQNSTYLLCQLEVSLDVTLTSLKIAKESKCKTILNLTPINDKPIILEMLNYTDILIVNEIELFGIYKSTFNYTNSFNEDDINELVKRGNELIEKYNKIENIIVTLGGKGQLLICKNSNESCHIELKSKVKVIDTTGAGDSFIGSLAHYLTNGNNDIKQSIELASKVASISVTRHGTQSSYPSINEL